MIHSCAGSFLDRKMPQPVRNPEIKFTKVRELNPNFERNLCSARTIVNSELRMGKLFYICRVYASHSPSYVTRFCWTSFFYFHLALLRKCDNVVPFS